MKLDVQEAVGLLSVAIAVLSIPPSLVFGAGMLLALFALLLSSLTAIHGDRLYVWTTMIIVTFDIVFVSGLSDFQDKSKIGLILLIGIPYLFSFLCIIVGFLRQRAKPKND